MNAAIAQRSRAEREVGRAGGTTSETIVAPDTSAGLVAMGARRFPTEPVRQLLAQRITCGDLHLADLAATTRLPLRTLRRLVALHDLDWIVADRCAVALGYHPCQLWPEWFAVVE